MINEMNFPNKSRVRKTSAFLIIGHETFNLCITLYETTPKWHGLLMLRRPASIAWIKQRTAEYRIPNNE